MIKKNLVLYAPNVHTGGGLVLLQALLAAWPESVQLTVFLDTRARSQLNVPRNSLVYWVTASVGSRLQAEFQLRSVSSCTTTVLCFHGLPPLLSSAAYIVVFQQNRNYLGLNSLSQFALRTRTRLLFERLVSRVFRRRVAEYFVQTPSMRQALKQWYGPSREPFPRIRILPFINTSCPLFGVGNTVARWDFVYVADGEVHKNHRMLFAAWQLLADDGLRPSLALTLGPQDEVLKAELAAWKKKVGLQITDLGRLPHESVLSLYATAAAMIFPSTSESFGLPLLEATKAGLPILASELDYVRDVCRPVETFDPTSAVSIARAVKRFLAVPQSALLLRSPEEFWHELLHCTTQ